MPSIFSGMIADQRQRDSRAIAQQDAMMRMMEMRQRALEAERFRQYMANFQNQNSPAAARERRLALHQKLLEDQKLSWSKYAMMMDESEVPQEQRAKFRNMQKLIMTDPMLYADVAQRLVQQMKPHTIQRLMTSGTDADGNPINSFEIYDPNNPGLSAMGSSIGGSSGSPIGGGGGTRPAAPALRTLRPAPPPPKSRLDALTDHFMGSPDAPPPLPGVGAPPPLGLPE